MVGLGNPGDSFGRTRHNVGEAFGRFVAGQYHFPKLKMEKKFQALVSESEIKGQKVMLVLPQTYMNMSGRSVGALVRFYRLEVGQDLLVVFDDLDLVLGKYKLTRSLPHVHGGIKSVRDSLGGGGFMSLRLGTDERAGLRVVSGADYVLENFSKEASEKLCEQVFPAALGEVVERWL
jgi:PTH1 family peptidyl-tRNA hydrolase